MILRVLMLEDHPADVFLIKRAITKAFPDTLFTVAGNEQEFLEYLGLSTYDLILSDYNLPGYNGLEALLFVKEHYPRLPFIFVTGMLNSEEKSAQAILQGANGYVLKQNIGKLAAQIQLALNGAAEKHELYTEEQQKLAREKLRLQKINNMLQNSGEFEGKNAILEELKHLVDFFN